MSRKNQNRDMLCLIVRFFMKSAYMVQVGFSPLANGSKPVPPKVIVFPGKMPTKTIMWNPVPVPCEPVYCVCLITLLFPLNVCLNFHILRI